MENKVVFRNHISTVLEGTFRAAWVILFVFLGNFLGEEESAKTAGDWWIFVGVMVAALALVIAWQLIIWAKTYITIQENTIVVERKTLNHKKNTIGIQNISNVNLEQNLFEMIIGCCKVKLDTNSLSTANETDVKIVLKKKDAEQFKTLILGKLHSELDENLEEGLQNENVDAGVQGKSFIARDRDVVQHGIFSIKVAALLVFIVGVMGLIGIFMELLETGLGESLLEILMSLFVLIWFLGSSLWKILKGFIQYIDFKVERRGNQIHINYGLLKKINYSIPADKINALTLSQTGLARICKRYMVEVINVGMGDDENEANSFFLPYAKKEQIEERIKMLLPEFQDCLQIQEKRQPKCVWIVWLLPATIYLLVMAIILMVVVEFLPELLGGAIGGVVGVSLCILVMQIASYVTVGSKMQDDFLKVVSGRVGRKIVFIKSDKIQFVTLKQNFIAKKFGIQKGTIHLLAAVKNQLHDLPYFDDGEKIL